MKNNEWCNSRSLKVLSVPGCARPQHRKFLVFVVPQKGMESPLLSRWTKDRNFDIAARFYEEPGSNERLLEMADFTMTGGLSKFHAASQFLELSDLRAYYEGYMFLDGDLEFDAEQLSDFLDFCYGARLDLAQPSVTRDSYCYWKMAYHQPSYVYRETSFVEVMAPYISRTALAQVLPTFSQSISTYGLDLVWPSLIKSKQIGVVDAFQMRHRERVDHASGGFYKYLRSIGIDLDEEERRILASYGVIREQAHSRRGYLLKKKRMNSNDKISLASVPLYEIEKKTERQWIIDICMRLAAIGPSRPEVTKSTNLQNCVRRLLDPQ